jgi:hypothetical protein
MLKIELEMVNKLKMMRGSGTVEEASIDDELRMG